MVWNQEKQECILLNLLEFFCLWVTKLIFIFLKSSVITMVSSGQTLAFSKKKQNHWARGEMIGELFLKNVSLKK